MKTKRKEIRKNFVMSEIEHNRLIEACNILGLNQSEFIRLAIIERAMKVIRSYNKEK